ncbi:MAG TPA: DUF1499 domain-containing protein [Gammaproteobacteria bacterium]|nr:DUF1499 domain-containing protein [Gammaproteobacteria bacterium]
MPTSNKFARVGIALVIASVVTAVLSPIGNRSGWWGYGGAVEVLTWAGYGGLVATAVCLAGLLVAIRSHSGMLPSLLGLLIMVPVLLFLQYWHNAKNTLPPIHDISTDVVDAPDFWVAPNSNLYGGSKEAAMQQQAYPDIKPLFLPIATARAFALAKQAIVDTGWKIFDMDPENGRIEATEKTFWFGYSDDIVVRISQGNRPNGSRIDVRSSSRFGSGTDGGTNARRVRKILDAIRSKYSSD